MNSFYHQVSFSFNVWYIVLPFFMFAMGVLGARRYSLELKTMRIKKKGRNFTVLTSAVAIILEALLAALLVKESSAGIIQLCANALTANDSVYYAFIMAGFIQFCIFMAFYALLVGSEKLGEYASLGYLTEARRVAKKEIQEEEEESEMAQIIIPFPNEPDFPL